VTICGRLSTAKATLFAVVLMTACSTYGQSTTDGVSVDRLGIVLCHEDDEPPRDDWSTNIFFALTRSLHPSMVNGEIQVRREPCSKRMADAACFGVPGVLFCRSAALKRILVASAWMTASFVITGGEHYDRYVRTLERPVKGAFRYADGAYENHDIAEIIDGIRQIEGAEATGNDSLPDSEFSPFVPFYQAIADINLAALIGHEVAHAFDDTCPLTSKSNMEQSGLFSLIVQQQLSDRLFCPRFPVVEEVKADRCALRHLSHIGQETSHSLATDDGIVGEFVRRSAADMVAFQTLMGWRRFESFPRGLYTIVSLDSYLYGPYRLLLLASEIHGRRPNPAVCGNAAELFVDAVQHRVRACGQAGGILTDELLAMLSPRLVDSWGSDTWTEETFTCRN